MKQTWICFMLLICGCSLIGGDDDSVSGNLISTIAQTFIQGSPQPEITIVGQSVSGFSAQFSESGFGSPKVGFKLNGLNKNSRYIFEVSQNGLLDSIITFPFSPASDKSIDIAAVPLGTIALIRDAAAANMVVVDPNKGIVMGQLSSNGTGCSPILTVSVSSSSGSTSGIAGPYYFDPNGNLVTTNFSDNECNYVFFNVAQGNYTLSYDSQFSTRVAEVNVTAFNNKVTFGLNIP